MNRMEINHKYPLFSAIQIQTITGCNRRCHFCPIFYRRVKHEIMNDNLLKLIVDQLADLGFQGRISPYLMNEPLLDNTLEKKIHFIRKKCPFSYIMLNTNGDFLTIERLQLLFASGLNGLIINCYDGGAHLKKFSEMVNETFANNSSIVIQPQIDEYEIQRRDLKYIKIKDCSHYAVNSPFLNNRAGNVMGRVEINLPLNKFCIKPFRQMYINYEGTAILCCQDWNFEVPIANITQKKLKNIWSDEKLMQYRERLKLKDRSSYLCSKCDCDD